MEAIMSTSSTSYSGVPAAAAEDVCGFLRIPPELRLIIYDY
jgi:hypothetical protein